MSARVQALDYELSGPYAHENLEIYLVHGKDRIASDHKLVPLSEAIEQKLAIVHETGNVNELAIENVSDDVDVYVQSGDIVQGGKQDRTMATDLVVRPKSGKVPIASFCVEQGRWQGRGAEATHMFSSASNAVASNSLKRAINISGAQTEVWQEVAKVQDALSRQLGVSTRGAASPSSLELTLDGKEVQERRNAYTEALAKIASKSDAIGYAAVINGKVKCADIYPSHQLFETMWSKLLEASAVEAVAEKDGEVGKTTVADVRSFLEAADQGKASKRSPVKGVDCVRYDNSTNDFLETQVADKSGKKTWLHRTYLSK